MISDEQRKAFEQWASRKGYDLEQFNYQYMAGSTHTAWQAWQAAQQEPAQAVPTFWASENIFNDSLRDNIACILTTTKCAANTVPLYTHPVEQQAVPVGYMHANTESWLRTGQWASISPQEDVDQRMTVPVYTHPAPLDSDTRKMVLELCNTIINGSIYWTVTLAKQIRERLEAGE